MAGEGVADRLAQLALFSDLRWPELEAVTHQFEEEVFGAGQRVLRAGLTGSGFYLILEGDASVLVGGVERRRMGRGDFFGEISALTGEPPSADVRAESLLRCLVLAGRELEPFLLEHPTVLLRMLQAEARRLRDAGRWQ